MIKYLVWILTLVSGSFITYKIFYLGYSPDLILPEKSYKVQYNLFGETNQNEESLTGIKAFLPSDDSRQTIFDETFNAGPFSFNIEGSDFNKLGVWETEKNIGKFKAEYKFSVTAKAIAWEIDPSLELKKSKNSGPYLSTTEMIDYNHPEIEALYQKLIGDNNNILNILKVSFDYVRKIETLPFKGSTSALTALLLQKSSCNGKSRLMVALLRRAGIPSRVIGGLILENSSKKTTHQWVEAQILNQWVTFDPTNNYFAKIPSHYLKIYESDNVLFSHSKKIGFDWNFATSSFLSPSSQLYRLQSDSFNVLSLFEWIHKTGVSLNIIKILLVLPIGALIATFFRNVIGLQTFGTFLPALIAASSQDTGIVWGLIGFSFVILAISLVRLIFEQLDLMHTPKLSAMLSVVVILLISLSLLSVKIPFIDLTHVTLFPIAILTLTSERFSLTLEERGYLKAFMILLQTLFVTGICFFFMNNLVIQTLLLAFPEITLFIIALNIWLGQWIGLRLMEYWRFRKLIFLDSKYD